MRAHIDLSVEVLDHERVGFELVNPPALHLSSKASLWLDVPAGEAGEYLQTLADAALGLKDEIEAAQMEAKR